MTDAHYWFCTLFDRNYLFRGLALYRSLERHAGKFTLFVLCMDDESFGTLSRLRLPNARPVRLAEFEDAALLQAKKTRSPLEYYWTCTPSLPLFVLEREPRADVVTYLDSDLFFYADPGPLFEEMGSASVMIHEHRFPPRLGHLAKHGRYNVGWVSFRRDDRGLAVLRRWREQCIDWCYHRPEEGRLGDQSYLDTWTRDFDRVHVMRHNGGGLAPWNIEQYAITNRPDGRVFVDGDPLIFYHFHGVRTFEDGSIQRTHDAYRLRPADIRLVYDPYAVALEDARSEVQRVAPGFRFGLEHRDAPAAKDAMLDVRAFPTVHALMPVHNRMEYTRECLRCFEQQDYPHINVVVIDDGSTDGTAAMLHREFPRVTVLRGNGKLWWTGSMWRGVEHVQRVAHRDDYVLCINNDTTFDKDYVSTLVRVSREHGGALVGSLLRSWTDRSLISIGPVIAWRDAEVSELATKTVDAERLCAQETIETLDALPGRGTLVPLRVFRRVGNFRRWLLPHYAADYEFSARAKRRGEKLVLSTRAVVYTAPDPPEPVQEGGLRDTLRSMFSRRSRSNVVDHLVLFAVSGPLAQRPRALYRIARSALGAVHSAASEWLKRRDASANPSTGRAT